MFLLSDDEEMLIDFLRGKTHKTIHPVPLWIQNSMVFFCFFVLPVLGLAGRFFGSGGREGQINGNFFNLIAEAEDGWGCIERDSNLRLLALSAPK